MTCNQDDRQVGINFESRRHQRQTIRLCHANIRNQDTRPRGTNAVQHAISRSKAVHLKPGELQCLTARRSQVFLVIYKKYIGRHS